MINPIKTLLGIAHQRPWHIWLGYNLFSITEISFWTLIYKPVRNLLFCTIINPMPILFWFACRLHWPIFDLGYNLFSLIGMGFQIHTSTKPTRILLFGPMMNPIMTVFGIPHQLSWPIFGLAYNLYNIIGMGFQTLIPEPNYLGCYWLAHWSTLMKTLLGISHQLWPIFDLHSVILIPTGRGHIGFQTIIPEWN